MASNGLGTDFTALGLKDRGAPITQLVGEKIIAVGRLTIRRIFPRWSLKSWEVDGAGVVHYEALCLNTQLRLP
jgi:hypothetical protein